MVLDVRPSFAEALAAIEEYRQRGSLRQAQLDSLSQIRARVRRLESRISRLFDLNDTLWRLNGLRISLDAERDQVRIESPGILQTIQLNRTDPNTPLQFRELARFAGYWPDRDTQIPEELRQARELMEGEVEAFYSDAHRLHKQVQVLLGIKKDECKEIAIVRNNLLEHPVPGVTPTFGYGSTGPQISPINSDKILFRDSGAFHNAVAFNLWLVRVFRKYG